MITNETIKNSIIPVMIHKDTYGVSSSLKHSEILDLAVLYSFSIGEPNGGRSPMKAEHLEVLGLTEDELWALAIKNAKRDYPLSVIDICELFEGASATPGGQMYVIQSEKGFAAYALTDPAFLKKVSFECFNGDDMLIMPSSVHDLVIVSSEDYTVDEALDMLHAGNEHTDTGKFEWLSDNVYLFDYATRTLRFADENKISTVCRNPHLLRPAV